MSTAAASVTVGKVLCWAQRRLADAGLVEAKLEARILTARALGIDRGALVARSHDVSPPGLSARLAPLLDRRAAREPLAHIIGSTEFYGLDILTGPGGLIPRNDSETLVGVALEYLPEGSSARVADLGTGTGCLLLAVLANRPGVSGEGIDASSDAIELARENGARSGLSLRASFTVASWSDWAGWAEADLVLSNPPYIRSDVIETLEPEVRDHDPQMALDGGLDGLDAYREIIGLAGREVRAGTPLILEIGYDQADAVSRLLETAGFSGIRLGHDLGNNPRVLSAVKN